MRPACRLFHWLFRAAFPEDTDIPGAISFSVYLPLAIELLYGPICSTGWNGAALIPYR